MCFCRNLRYRKSQVSSTGRFCYLVKQRTDCGVCCLCSLPGSVVERQLQESLSRMFPELLRFSSSSRLLPSVPMEIRDAHRVGEASNSLTTIVSNNAAISQCNLWDEWADNEHLTMTSTANACIDDDDDVDLSAMGF